MVGMHAAFCSGTHSTPLSLCFFENHPNYTPYLGVFLKTTPTTPCIWVSFLKTTPTTPRIWVVFQESTPTTPRTGIIFSALSLFYLQIMCIFVSDKSEGGKHFPTEEI